MTDRFARPGSGKRHAMRWVGGACAPFLLAAGCDQAEGPMPPSPTPTVSPSPTPTPTPTPTPSPTPTPLSYTPFDQLTDDSTPLLQFAVAFESWGLVLEWTAMDLAYTPSTRTWVLGDRTNPPDSRVTFSPATIVETTPDLVRYALSAHPKPVPRLPGPRWSDPAWLPHMTVYTPLIGGVRPQYVRGYHAVGYESDLATQSGVIGVGTKPQDKLSGVLRYKLWLFGSVNGLEYDISGSPGIATITPDGQMNVEIDFIARSTTGGRSTSFGHREVSGIVLAIDNGFLVKMRLTPNPEYMRGSFFGPGGREIGGTITLLTHEPWVMTAGFIGIQE